MSAGTEQSICCGMNTTRQCIFTVDQSTFISHITRHYQHQLKGVYEDYTWGYHWTIPFHEFQFQLVPLIPYSAITKTILVRFLIFQMFTSVENQPLKRRLKLKQRIIFKNLQNSFSFSKRHRNTFCWLKYIIELYLEKSISANKLYKATWK